MVVLATLALAAGCERQPDIQPSGKGVKLAIVGPFSGPDRAIGEEGVKGIQTAIHLNPLLDNGDAVELVTVDDQNEPVLTAEAIGNLAEDDELAAVMLMSTSASGLAAGAVADARKMPVLAMLATHSEITKDHQFISHLCYDNTFQGSVAALFVRDELFLDKVAVIKDTESFYSRQLADEFIKKFASIGGTISDVRALENKSGSYAEALGTLRDRGTELLYLPVKAKEVIRIVEAAKETGWSPVMMGGDGLLAGALTQYPDDVGLLEGMYATDFFSSGMPLTNYGKKAVRAYKSLFDRSGTTYTTLGAEAYLVLHGAMNRCKKPSDRECVNRMLRSTRNLEGLTGRISIHKDGKAARPLVVNAIRDGYMTFVVKVY